MSDMNDDPENQAEIIEQGHGWSHWKRKNDPYLFLSWGDGKGEWQAWYLDFDADDMWLGVAVEDNGELWNRSVDDITRIEARAQEVGFVTHSGEWLPVATVEDAAGLVASIMKAVRAAKAALLPPPPAGFDL